MTSVGHFSLASQTANNPSVSTFFMTLVGEQPGFTPKDFQELWKERGMAERHPRFHYTVSEDNPGHFEPETKNDHIQETFFPYLYRKEIQSRIAALQTVPLNVHEKTWEVQIAASGPLGVSGGVCSTSIPREDLEDRSLVESVIFFRGHHALGDGVSLFTAVMDLCDEADDIRQMIQLELKKRFKRNSEDSLPERLARQVKKLVFFWIGCLQAMLYQGQIYVETLLEANPMKQLHRWTLQLEGSDDDVTPKRTISFSMAAPVKEVKWVAQTLIGKNATVNDVFVSCVSAAVARQLNEHRQRLEVLDIVDDEVNEKKQRRHRHRRQLSRMESMNIVMPVHLYGGVMLPGQSMGNRIGAMIARVPGENRELSCVDRLEQVHNTLYALKQTPTPLLSYLLVRLTSSISGTFLPSSWTQFLFSKASANAAAVVSNVRGPHTPLHIKGRLIQSVHGFVPLPPGIPIGVVVGSYADNVQLSLSAETWAVPDGDQFLVFVLEEYQALLEQAIRRAV
jgi:WS/DGAT C-terminal domain